MSITSLTGSELTPDAAAAEPRTFARGRLRALRQLGSTEEGETWLAEDLENGGRFVVKTSRVREHGVEEKLDQLRSELRLFAGLSGSCVELGWENGYLFRARPYVEGITLAERLRRGPLAEGPAMRLAVSLFRALAPLHATGRYHRHLTPENIIVHEDLSTATYLDFEPSASQEPAPEARSAPAGVYRAPEEVGVLDRPPGPWSNFYSLGVILYEAVAGTPPFNAADEKRWDRPVPPLPAGRIASPLFEMFLHHLLQKEPGARYRSAAAALQDLEKIQQLLSGKVVGPDLIMGSGEGRNFIADPALVGRGPELEFLRAQRASASEGRGGLILLAAESGGGKTRLLREFATENRWTVFGQASDEAGHESFRPLRGVVSSLLERTRKDSALADQLRDKLADYADVLLDFFPELDELFGERRFRGLGSEAWAQNRGVRALMALLDHLGRPGEPCVVLLDDCQWADELSLQLLSTWARTPGEQAPLPCYTLLVAAFRSEDLEGSARPLKDISHGRFLKLRSLNEAELRTLAESMVGWLPERVTHAVAALSGGSPFMAAALVHGFLEAGTLRRVGSNWITDETRLQEASAATEAATFLVDRLRSFSTATLDALLAGAVLGRRFRLSAAAQVAERSLPATRSALDEACDRKVLLDREGFYSFAHDKLREALLSMLSPDAKRALHLGAAEWLKKNSSEAVGEIAYHYFEGGRRDLGLPFALQAARRARAGHSPRVAEQFFLLAEQALAALGPGHVGQIGRELGEVQTLLGKYDEAEVAFSLAVPHCRTQLERAEVQAGLADLAFKRGDFAHAAVLTETALRALGARVPRGRWGLAWESAREVVVQVLHGLFPQRFLGRRPAPGPQVTLELRLLTQLAYVYFMGRSRVYSTWAHLRGMNLAEQYPPTAELAHIYSCHGPAVGTDFWPKRGLDYVERSLSIRRKLGDLWGEGQSLHFLGYTLYANSRFKEAHRVLSESVQVLERTGDIWELDAARWYRAESAYRQGLLETAAAIGEETYREGLNAGNAQTIAFGLANWTRAALGQVPLEWIESALTAPKLDLHSRIELLQARAIVELKNGQPEPAIDALEEAERLVIEKNFWQEHSSPVLPLLATALRARLERLPAVAAGARKQALRAHRRAALRAQRISFRFPNNAPHALRERGYAEALAGRRRLAQRYFERSIAKARAQGAALEVALSEAAWGEVGCWEGWHDAQELRSRAETKLAELSAYLRGGVRSARPEAFSLSQRFASLLEAGHLIATALDRESLYASLCRATAQLLRGQHCLILEEEAGAFELRYNSGSLPFDAESLLDRRLLARAVEERRPVVAENLPGPGSRRPGLAQPRVRSAMAVPVLSHVGRAACLYVCDERWSDRFGEAEQQVAHFLATIAGAALENADSFSRLKALSEERASLHEAAAQALKSRDEFLTLASHELRTPLTSTLLQCQMLLRRLRKDPQAAPGAPWLERSLVLSETQLKHLKRLVDDLMNVAQINSGRFHLEPVPLALDELVREAAEGLREASRQAGGDIVLGEISPVRVRGDKGRIGQVITNLVTNAMKYAPGSPVEIQLHQHAGQAELSVRDFGPGIPLEHQARIFGRFERAPAHPSTSGLGLGLFIAAQIVQAHGGSIALESEPGQGCLFRLKFPLDPTPAPEKFPPPTLA